MPIIINPKKSTTSGTLTGAENGTIVAANKVQLGGNPLIQDTGIDLATFVLAIFANNGANSVSARWDPIAVQFAAQVISALGSADFQIDPLGGITLNTTDSTFAKNVGFIIQNTGTIFFDDTNQLGFTKDPAILAANQLANPLAYVTTDCLGAALYGTINIRNQNATTTTTLYTVPAGKNQLLRVNPAFLINGLGATTNVQLDLLYTDEASNVQTVNLINTGVINPDNSLSPIVIYAEKATTVSLRATLNIPGATYNLYASCEYLGVQN